MTTINDAIRAIVSMFDAIHAPVNVGYGDNRNIVTQYLQEQEKAEAVDKTEGYILGEPSIQKLRDDLALAKEGLRLAKVLILCIRSEDYEKKANRFLNICGKLGINEKD